MAGGWQVPWLEAFQIAAPALGEEPELLSLGWSAGQNPSSSCDVGVPVGPPVTCLWNGCRKSGMVQELSKPIHEEYMS